MGCVDTMTWTQINKASGFFPPGLRGHSANILGNKIFLFGGYDGRGRSNELYTLDIGMLDSAASFYYGSSRCRINVLGTSPVT